MVTKSLDQERAKFCLERVREIKEKKEEVKSKYKTYARRLPALIINNGLIPTIAFYKSKEYAKTVYEHLNDWFRLKVKFVKEDIFEEILEKDTKEIMLITAEALEFAKWLKRIVEIELEDVKESE